VHAALFVTTAIITIAPAAVIIVAPAAVIAIKSPVVVAIMATGFLAISVTIPTAVSISIMIAVTVSPATMTFHWLGRGQRRSARDQCRTDQQDSHTFHNSSVLPWPELF
jgi:hypothetical protein